MEKTKETNTYRFGRLDRIPVESILGSIKLKDLPKKRFLLKNNQKKRIEKWLAASVTDVDDTDFRDEESVQIKDPHIKNVQMNQCINNNLDQESQSPVDDCKTAAMDHNCQGLPETSSTPNEHLHAKNVPEAEVNPTMELFTNQEVIQQTASADGNLSTTGLNTDGQLQMHAMDLSMPKTIFHCPLNLRPAINYFEQDSTKIDQMEAIKPVTPLQHCEDKIQMEPGNFEQFDKNHHHLNLTPLQHCEDELQMEPGNFVQLHKNSHHLDVVTHQPPCEELPMEPVNFE